MFAIVLTFILELIFSSRRYRRHLIERSEPMRAGRGMGEKAAVFALDNAERLAVVFDEERQLAAQRG